MNPDTILKLIAESGYTLEELAALDEGSSSCPTVADYLPKVEAATGAAADTYRTYWRQLAARFGDRRLNTIKVSDLQEAALAAAKNARRRSNSVDGRGAEENFTAAARRFFELAVKDGHIARNPAKDVVKRRRNKSRRRALTEGELAELWGHIDVGSDDPELDRLLVRFHLETGARREGALNLRLRDLDSERQTLRLQEKYGKHREQPVSATLLKALEDHARRRGDGKPESPVFHYRNRRNGQPHPLSRKRYNTLFPRLQEQMGWAARIGLCAHILRHTAITMIEREAGYEVARAFAGHEESETTSTYSKATIEEVSAAVEYLTGEPHPLAPKTEGSEV